MAATFDFIDEGQVRRAVYRGETLQRVFTYKDSDGVAVDLTGYSASMQVRKSLADGVALELSTVNSRITLGGAAGTVTILVSAADTATIDVGQYFYDLELTSGSSVVTRLIEGRFQVKEAYTR